MTIAYSFEPFKKFSNVDRFDIWRCCIGEFYMYIYILINIILYVCAVNIYQTYIKSYLDIIVRTDMNIIKLKIKLCIPLRWRY